MLYKQHYVTRSQNSSGISNGSAFYVEWKVHWPYEHEDQLESTAYDTSAFDIAVTLSSKEFKHTKSPAAFQRFLMIVLNNIVAFFLLGLYASQQPSCDFSLHWK